MNARYLLLEARRITRAPRFLIFTVGFPVVFYLLFSSMYAKGSDIAAVKAGLMVSMAAFGALTAAVSTGSRIAVERGSGWQRQLRLTPMPGSTYLVTKAIVGMVIALGPMLLVYALGAATGVHLDAAQWVLAFLGTWVGLVPLAVLGVVIGQLASADSVQVVGSATFMLLSIGGGLWIPPEQMPDWLSRVAHVLPSFWYGGIGRDVVARQPFDGHGVWVLLAWTAGLALFAMRRFRSDTARV